MKTRMLGDGLAVSALGIGCMRPSSTAFDRLTSESPSNGRRPQRPSNSDTHSAN